ncbi:transcriptional regulator [Streptosporangium jomthongense]|uniref:Nuclear transport factor 2 family protein n=1 Tax=Marinobacter aromaticivorans TaxID=1494078 RepID=A0ABW2IYB9_9GAMM|nr:nuclear transport factor 2 family protein [Marinobacter aromaticivorans]GGE73145.1 transcriptional regulator [Streptosporangium jomthongense]
MNSAPAIEVGHRDSPVPAVLEEFRVLFNQLDKGNLGKLPTVYSGDIRFIDPLGSVEGIDALNHYFAGAYANVISCRFEFDDSVVQGRFATIPWLMHLRHKRIRGGREIQVAGISHLEIEAGKICYHRDYFDAGQLLYENLPVIGGVIRWVKGYAG